MIYEAYLSYEDGDEANVIDDDNDEEDADVGDDVHAAFVCDDNEKFLLAGSTSGY